VEALTDSDIAISSLDTFTVSKQSTSIEYWHCNHINIWFYSEHIARPLIDITSPAYSANFYYLSVTLRRNNQNSQNLARIIDYYQYERQYYNVHKTVTYRAKFPFSRLDHIYCIDVFPLSYW